MMRPLTKLIFLTVAGTLAAGSDAVAQANPARVPSPEELVRALQQGPSLGADGAHLVFDSCPVNGTREAAILNAVSAAELPTESVVALAVNWANLLESNCALVGPWYESALEDVVASGDYVALSTLMLALPEDITPSMRESFLRVVSDRRHPASVLVDALKRAMHHSDVSVSAHYALQAFQSVRVDEAPIRDAVSAESASLYRRLGSEYIRLLTQAAERMPDRSLRVAAYPIAHDVSKRPSSSNLDELQELRSALQGREGMEHLLELLRPVGR